jgi:hypothetical protein
MNILVLNGNPDPENATFDGYLLSYQLRLHKMGHYLKTYQLRDMIIAEIDKYNEHQYQEESFFPEDDARYIFNSLNETDLLILASPLKQGFTSVLTKIIQNRMSRRLQYEFITRKFNREGSSYNRHIPLMGMILQKEPDTTRQEILLNRLTQERIAANLMTVLSIFITTEVSLADAVCETLKSADHQLCIENTCRDFLTGSPEKFNLL